ncbi:hypothetical protein HDU92_004986 [Lobulomyces angularis]|nr:hypothetical protein HDU92_004986 [Lobulomyces angularis]
MKTSNAPTNNFNSVPFSLRNNIMKNAKAPPKSALNQQVALKVQNTPESKKEQNELNELKSKNKTQANEIEKLRSELSTIAQSRGKQDNQLHHMEQQLNARISIKAQQMQQLEQNKLRKQSQEVVLKKLEQEQALKKTKAKEIQTQQKPLVNLNNIKIRDLFHKDNEEHNLMEQNYNYNLFNVINEQIPPNFVAFKPQYGLTRYQNYTAQNLKAPKLTNRPLNASKSKPKGSTNMNVNIDCLPKNVLQNICSYLDSESIKNFSQINSVMRKAFKDLRIDQSKPNSLNINKPNSPNSKKSNSPNSKKLNSPNSKKPNSPSVADNTSSKKENSLNENKKSPKSDNKFWNKEPASNTEKSTFWAINHSSNSKKPEIKIKTNNATSPSTESTFWKTSQPPKSATPAGTPVKENLVVNNMYMYFDPKMFDLPLSYTKSLRPASPVRLFSKNQKLNENKLTSSDQKSGLRSRKSAKPIPEMKIIPHKNNPKAFSRRDGVEPELVLALFLVKIIYVAAFGYGVALAMGYDIGPMVNDFFFNFSF